MELFLSCLLNILSYATINHRLVSLFQNAHVGVKLPVNILYMAPRKSHNIRLSGGV